jgi:DNA (cytosine-5)-methyltransferase 1
MKAIKPLQTVVTKDQVAVVTVTIDGQEYAIVDIGMRMLKPREPARAQGFPDSYVLTDSQGNQVARIGNSVCPQCAQAVIGAQIGTWPTLDDEEPCLFREAA